MLAEKLVGQAVPPGRSLCDLVGLSPIFVGSTPQKTGWRPILLGFVRCATAGGLGPGGVDRGVSLLYINNLPVLIDHKGRAVGHASLLDQHAIGLRHFPLGEIAEQGKGRAHLGGKLFLGRSVVGADPKDLGVR